MGGIHSDGIMKAIQTPQNLRRGVSTVTEEFLVLWGEFVQDLIGHIVYFNIL